MPGEAAPTATATATATALEGWDLKDTCLVFHVFDSCWNQAKSQTKLGNVPIWLGNFGEVTKSNLGNFRENKPNQTKC